MENVVVRNMDNIRRMMETMMHQMEEQTRAWSVPFILPVYQSPTHQYQHFEQCHQVSTLEVQIGQLANNASTQHELEEFPSNTMENPKEQCHARLSWFKLTSWLFNCSMDYCEWTENSRGTYNKWDGIARTTAQVYPGAWTAILISLDNVGVWNLRTENLDSWYLGHETYVRVVNPEPNNKTEFPIPDNALFCGALSRMQKPQDISFATSIKGSRQTFLACFLLVISALFSMLG